MSNTVATETKSKYSKILSTLFSSNAVIALSILCLLNNLTLDIYTCGMLVKIVIPAAICFWILGYSVGTILDSYNKKKQMIEESERVEDEKAYEIPSMFADPVAPPEAGETSEE